MSTATPANPMNQASPTGPATTPSARPPASNGPTATGRKRRGGILIALAAGLVVSGLARTWALGLQTKAYLNGPYADTSGGGGDAASAVSTTLGNADSYFLVLMLGGLRGPLVMYLWSSSENQKNERDLEDFNTKVNLIRLLQPEFDSVHIFQTWNKAYNISVQIASLPDRYATILDAAEYAKEVARSRKNNVNILLTLNQVFQQKLGLTVTDNVYYRKQVRADSKWRPPETVRAGAMAQRMEPMLDKEDRLLPALLGTDPATGQPMRGVVRRPTDLQGRVYLPVRRADELRKAAAGAGVTLPALTPAPGEQETVVTLPEADARKLADVYFPPDVAYVYADWNEGSDMQYLAEYGPFPYGVSPLAIGYDYGKRAQVLINKTKQKPAQYSGSVVDSRPGIELRDWAKEERDRALAAEARLYGRPNEDRKLKEWLVPAKLVPEGSLEMDFSAVAKAYFANPSAPPPQRNRDQRYDEAIVEKMGQALATARVPSDNPVSGADVDEALYSYRLSARLLQDARSEFIRHLNHPEVGIRRLQDFSSQIEELSADQLIGEADFDFLLALTPDAGASQEPLHGQGKLVGREVLLRRAAEKYRQAIIWFQTINLRYYFPAEITQLTLPPQLPGNAVSRAAWEVVEVLRQGIAKLHLSRLAEYNNIPEARQFPLPISLPRESPSELRWDPSVLDRVYAETEHATKLAPKFDQNRSNRDEGLPAEDRAKARLAEIERLLGAGGGNAK